MTVKNFEKRQVSENVFNFLESTALSKIKDKALKFGNPDEGEKTFFLNNMDEIKALYDDIWGERDSTNALTDALLFLKLTGLYELKQEPKYFIKLPHFVEEDSYINYFPLDDEIDLSDEEEVDNCQTQFTMKEIENNPMLKEYSEYAVEVTE